MRMEEKEEEKLYFIFAIWLTLKAHHITHFYAHNDGKKQSKTLLNWAFFKCLINQKKLNIKIYYNI